MKPEEKLASLRKAKGLSQLKLAEMMNVSRQAISKWEVGTAVPSVENLQYLSKLYGVPMESLLDESMEEIEITDDPGKPHAGREENRKNRKRLFILICILALILGAALIGAVVIHSGSEEVNLNTAGSEDWNDSETAEIPIQW